MARDETEHDAAWESEGLDPEGPSGRDLERFGSETVSCPHCGAEVWDQAEQCHRCGEGLALGVDDGPGGRSRVAMLIVLLLLASFGASIFFL